MTELLVDDSLSKLEILDADINEIEDLTPFSTLSNLKMLSLRSNNVLSSSYFTNKKTLVLNSKNLLALDYHKSDIEKVEHNSGLENPDLLRIIKIDSYTNPDGSYNSDVDTF
jgi:hypothetical protein